MAFRENNRIPVAGGYDVQQHRCALALLMLPIGATHRYSLELFKRTPYALERGSSLVEDEEDALRFFHRLEETCGLKAVAADLVL
eukprot:CAMPEP_0115242244 /NCGR_PEP_ID=MMETSP0270-20121206/38852_1 /TAXON_ID=71861 /ORGANISM="Scrippsiella trochoidea, Strain CCMP3099" /LENGTH=84 /DNA_ID=CAMNT_0002657303 /DNA_START=79 /DNA_END=333 /DNA_ORIENTATION=-